MMVLTIVFFSLTAPGGVLAAELAAHVLLSHCFNNQASV
jgi:hypothetical protein